MYLKIYIGPMKATLDFIKFFARRISQLPCLFILTYRDDEIHSRHPLQKCIGAIAPGFIYKTGTYAIIKTGSCGNGDGKRV